MPFLSEKKERKWEDKRARLRASSKERIGGTSNQEIPCPTGANNLDSVWREWSRQCPSLPHIFFIWTGTGRLGWVGRLPVSHLSHAHACTAGPMGRIASRGVGTAHRKPQVVERKNAACVTMAGLELFVHL